jgi:hypothetical protein
MDAFFNRTFILESIKQLELLFDIFEKSVGEGLYAINDMVIVFDIDDTLITMNLSDNYRVLIAKAFLDRGNIFNESELDNLEYAILEDKVPCEGSLTLGVLDRLNDSSINLTLVTSRRLHLHRATILNLRTNGILGRITGNKLYKPENDHIDLDRGVLYTDNVLLVSDQHKGLKFKEFLMRIGRSFKIIVVIDNTLNKINSFYESFNCECYIIGFLYTFIGPE